VFRPALGSFACALLLLGCGGDKAAPETDAPAAQTASPDEDPESLATPPAGWQRFDVDGYSIWLAEAFRGGQLEPDPDALISSIRDLGERCEGSADGIASFASAIVFVAVDSGDCDTRFVTNVNIVREELPGRVPPRQYMDNLIGFLPRSFDIERDDVVTVGERSAGRVETRTEQVGVEMRQVIWALPVDDAYWVVTYSAASGDFDDRLAEFERSMLTFENSLPD
jgi:hypothetical protein